MYGRYLIAILIIYIVCSCSKTWINKSSKTVISFKEYFHLFIKIVTEKTYKQSGLRFLHEKIFFQ